MTAILQAAAHVLAVHGAARFTTARVAERAGISIGSLYQYFPNKAAILFRLQSDEWRDTRSLLLALLTDTTRPPHDRIRAAVRAFVASEIEEAAMRQALEDAAPLYRDAAEAKAAKGEGIAAFRDLLREAAPALSDPARQVAAETIVGALKMLGKALSLAPYEAAERDARTEALADMLCAYMASLDEAGTNA
ncbi:TetR family transcriptional regulator [Novosphingobium nitrogenifigens]|uniref:TetR family transcriptional regulator n=1 Tax=Novosphingobium nitrogenifigens TaxID=378548 RepID=UPI001E4387BE|nr:TetR family transcriptional regulator [Novosphingobium nitrogenifigens]